MLGYTTGIAEQASTYGPALADDEFWRLAFVFSCVITSQALTPVSHLGKGGYTKTDEFLEKFQTAFDPPLIFGKSCCAFFPEYMT